MAKLQRVYVDGLRALAKDLKRMDKESRTGLALDAMEEVMKPVMSRARQEVPVDYMDLKDSIRMMKKVDRRGLRVDIRAGVPGPHGYYKKSAGKKPVYALQVEYGTAKTPAQPFMAPSMDHHEQAILLELKRELATRIFTWKGGKK
jgi:HK97 gp10 family phage protein